jgi:Fe-Mn family superoxide dismutase
MPFTLPELPYAYDALEAAIDAKTMEIHHTKHHATYIEKLNAALAGKDKWAKKTIEELLSDLDAVPKDIRMAVRNHGGGHYNHSFFWPLLSPDGGGEPKGKLGKAIDKTFKNFDGFRQEFEKAATGQFGSGWAWLVRDSKGKLSITALPNQDTPLSEGKTPVLGLDVWEHAYYLKYQNKRPDYIAAFWNVVNWQEVERRYLETA